METKGSCTYDQLQRQPEDEGLSSDRGVGEDVPDVQPPQQNIIQERLQEFTQKMAKINHLEMELKQVCQTVETVYKDLCVQSEVRMWGCILL